MSFISTSDLEAAEAASKARKAAKVATATVSVIVPGHGEYRTTAQGLDQAIAAYLPNSPGGLRAVAEDRAGHTFDGVYEASTFLVILADFDTAGEAHGTPSVLTDEDVETIEEAHAAAAAPDALAVDLIGPNLPARLAERGEIHVHAHGCGDVARQYKGHHVYTERHASIEDLVNEWYGNQIAENEGDEWGTWVAYLGEFYIAPCVRLPTTND